MNKTPPTHTTDPIGRLLRDIFADRVAEMNDERSSARAFIDSLETSALQDGTHLRAVAAARKVVEQAEALLLDAIRGSLAAGDSWTMIGLALRTSKQNAHRKYSPLLNERESLVDEHPATYLATLVTQFATSAATALTDSFGREVTKMAQDNDRHIVPSASGGWDVVKPGSQRVSSHHDTQSAAIDRGRDIVRNAGGGELNIHARDGQIRAKDTIRPGNDPRNIKG